MNGKVDFDVIIIGGGAAGLAAGIYCGRGGLKTLILEEDSIGGLASKSILIGNYPGFPKGISGKNLMEEFFKQACESKVQFIYEQVISIWDEKPFKYVKTNSKVYKSYGVIIATGASPNRTGAVNEDRFIGKGISFCSQCDGPEAEDKTILVVGTGDSAIDQSLYLSKIAREMAILSINPQGKFDCMESTKLKALFNQQKDIRIFWESEIIAFHGENHLSWVTIRNKNTGELINFHCQFCFEFIGFQPNSSIFSDMILSDELGAIITNDHMETNCSGIYAIGDVRKKPIKQVATAISDGAIAACFLSRYIDLVT